MQLPNPSKTTCVLDCTYNGVELNTKHPEAKTLDVLGHRVSFQIDKNNNLYFSKNIFVF
jgi:hypothetical protein